MKRKKLKFMDINENDILSRDEMRDVMAGSGGSAPDGFIECSCYTSVGGSHLGDVYCSDGFSYQKCCNTSFQDKGQTNYVDCTTDSGGGGSA